MTLSTVTQKGQVTLPKKMRDKLGIGIYEKVAIEIEKDYVKITPTIDILTLASSFKKKVKNPKDPLLARESFEKDYVRV